MKFDLKRWEREGRRRRWLYVFAVVLFFFTAAAWFVLRSLGASPVSLSGNDGGVYIRVRPGMSAAEVTDELLQKKIINSELHFKTLAWWNDLQENLKAGSYIVRPDMTYQEIIDLLMSGRTAAAMLTIPEGYSIEQIAKLLEDMGVDTKSNVLALAKKYAPYEYMAAGEDTLYQAEGFLFPDTYEVAHDQNGEEVLGKMAEEFDHKFTPKMRQRAQELQLSIREVVTLASLVEKEARFAEDRPLIAQVFLKRLAIGMPLQSDATIQYFLDAPKEDLSIEDTKQDSPYNTYRIAGLPPGPIANPGLDSINAVLYPADTNYLYFVADRQGKNHYTTAYEDHLAVVEQVR